jgi:hypothetical protein
MPLWKYGLDHLLARFEERLGCCGAPGFHPSHYLREIPSRFPAHAKHALDSVALATRPD